MVRRWASIVAVLAFAWGAALPAHAGERAADVPVDDGWLTGKFLVSTARIGDPRFARTVIFMIDHGSDGAMGLVINRVFGTGSLNSLLEGFGLETDAAAGKVRLHYGGPVDPARGFVLHSTDYHGPGTREIGDGVALSTGIDVLQALAAGDGPARRLVILGYAGWAPGQLESELARDDWVTAPADAALIFGEDPKAIWDRAMQRAGIAL